MNKYLTGIILAGTVFVGATAFSGRTGAVVGKFAPELDICLVGQKSNDSVDFRNTGEGYKLINFWTTSDVDSRLKGKIYTKWLENSEFQNNKLNYLSVNLDEDERLFREIIKIDRLKEDSQYACGNSSRKIIKEYDLQNGMKTFLVDSKGEIIMINPSTEDIEKLL